MSWNHRLMAHENTIDNTVYLAIHEVYYDKEGNPTSYTTNPVTIGSETIEGIKWTLGELPLA